MDTLQSGQIRYSALTCKVVGRVLELCQLGERVETTIEDEAVCGMRDWELVLRLLVVFGADRDEDAVAVASHFDFRTPLAMRLSLIALKGGYQSDSSSTWCSTDLDLSPLTVDAASPYFGSTGSNLLCRC